MTENPADGRPVIAATRRARASCIRCPLPELPALLATPAPQAAALMDRTWTLLSR